MAQESFEKRRFFRHPISMPILFQEVSTRPSTPSASVDVSEGGMAFVTDHFIPRGTALQLKIPVADQVFKIHGYVAYSNRILNQDQFKTGVAFKDSDSAFKAKLAEQMLKISDYQKKLSEENGMNISEEEAAQEWIKRYAKNFSFLF